MSRHANGEGSIFRRADGRYAAAFYNVDSRGVRRRKWLYARTRREVHEKLQEQLRLARQGVPQPERSWTTGAYLEHWLTTVVAVKNRASTLELYRGVVTNHLTPAIGRRPLAGLSVADVQAMLNAKLAAGGSIRTVHAIRSVLRTALSRAQREELIMRNVAKLVEIPGWHRKPIRPWTPDEARRFLQTASRHPWFAAYLVLLTFGLRRGEVLGLTWEKVHFDGRAIHIEQQLQRQGTGLGLVPLKTESSRRVLPLLPNIAAALPPPSGDDPSGFVFTSTIGTPIDPKNFVRTFKQLSAEAGVPVIALHHARHTTATMLKDLGVPVVDARLILGHAHVSTTQQLYQHGDISKQNAALTILDRLLTEGVAVKTAVNRRFFRGQSPFERTLTSGGPGGTRTLDTLLKRMAEAFLEAGLTPEILDARDRARAHVVGHVAVKNCCQNAPAGLDVESLFATMLVFNRLAESLASEGLEAESREAA